MPDNSDSDLRRMLVAYADAATWCTDLSEIAERLIQNCEAGETPPAAQLARDRDTTDRIRRHLAAHTADIDRLHTRSGV